MFSALRDHTFVPHGNLRVMWMQTLHPKAVYYLSFKLEHDRNHVQLFHWLKLGLSPNITCCTGEDLSAEHAFRTYANTQPDCSSNSFFMGGGGIDHVPVLSHSLTMCLSQSHAHSLAIALPPFLYSSPSWSTLCEVSQLHMLHVWWARSLGS